MTKILSPFTALCTVGFFARLSYAFARSPVLPLFALYLGAGPEAIGFAVGISEENMKAIALVIVCAFVAIFTTVPASAVDTKSLDFEKEVFGAEPKTFSSITGKWVIDKNGQNLVYAVDGRKWEKGLAASGVADKAKGLYGERYAEFLDNLETYKYFPLTIHKDIDSFTGGVITVSFKGISSRIDRAAGIAFNIKPNGDYLTIRANCLENNLVLWKMVKGKRSSVVWIRKIPTPSNTWHTLKVVINGQKVEGYLNDTKYIDYTHKEPISGKIGLWSKADSYVFFDDAMKDLKK